MRRASYLGDVPGHGRVVEVLPDVVVHAARHALEELGHVGAPAASGAPLPGSVVEHLAVPDEADEGTSGAHLCKNPHEHLGQRGVHPGTHKPRLYPFSTRSEPLFNLGRSDP